MRIIGKRFVKEFTVLVVKGDNYFAKLYGFVIFVQHEVRESSDEESCKKRTNSSGKNSDFFERNFTNARQSLSEILFIHSDRGKSNQAIVSQNLFAGQILAEISRDG